MTFNTKKEMIETLATKKGFSKAKAKEMIEDVLEVMEELIMDEAHDGLDIYGLVKFEVKEIPSRERRNPSTGEIFIAESCNQIKARMSSRIKKAIK